MIRYFLLACSAWWLVGCQSEEAAREEGQRDAVGNVNQVLVVTDSLTWNSTAGAAVRDLFEQSLRGLPTDVPLFSLRKVSPFALNRILKQHRHLLFLTTFDDNSPDARRMRSFFSEEAQAQMVADSTAYRVVSRDQHARGQLVMHLFAQDTAALARRVRANPEAILSPFRETEITYWRQQACRENNDTLQRALTKVLGIELCVPEGFAEARLDSELVWLRTHEEEDISLLITSRSYRNEAQFSADNLLAWRDEIGRRYLFGSGVPDTVSYMMRQDYVPESVREVSFNGAYGVEVRGLWKLKNNMRGGVYLAYALTDADRLRQYYVEAFVYAPTSNKRDYIRRAEAILRTFRPDA